MVFTEMEKPSPFVILFRLKRAMINCMSSYCDRSLFSNAFDRWILVPWKDVVGGNGRPFDNDLSQRDLV